MCIYTMCGLFLWRKTAAIQNILFYAWSISIAKDSRFAEKSRQEFVGISQISLLFFPDKTLESIIMIYHKKVSDYTTFTLMIK